jgi:hypothetical protein
MTVTLETKHFGLDTVKAWEANRLCQIAKKGAFHIVTGYPNQAQNVNAQAADRDSRKFHSRLPAYRNVLKSPRPALTRWQQPCSRLLPARHPRQQLFVLRQVRGDSLG